MAEEMKTAGGEVLFAASTSESDQSAALYQSYEQLTDPSFTGDRQACFDSILAAGSKTAAPAAKMLVAQFIPEFFGEHAGTSSDAAIMRQVDLCEDDGHRVRLCAMSGLPKLCGSDADSVSRIANMLGQMLLNESAEEQETVRAGLMDLIKRNVQGSLTALLTHIVGDDEALRAKVTEFMSERPVFNLLRNNLQRSEDVQTWLVEEVTKRAARVPQPVLKKLLSLAGSLKALKGKEGQEKLLAIVAAQAGVGGDEFKSSDVEAVRRFTNAFETAQPYFRRGASSDAWVNVLITHIVPVISTLPDDVAVAACKALAEVSPNLTATQAVAVLPSVYSALKAQLPGPPPAVAEGETAPAPKVNFSLVECLLFAFHAIAAHHRTSLPELCGLRVTAQPVFTGQPQDIMGTPSENRAEKALFVAALQRLAPIVNDFQKKFVAARKKLNETKDMDKEKRLLVQRAIDTTRNISVLAQALAKEQASLVPAGRIQLSWRQRQNRGDGKGKGKGKGGQQQQQGKKKGGQQQQQGKKKGGQQQQGKKKGGQQQQQGKKKGGQQQQGKKKGGQQQQGKKKGGQQQQQQGKKKRKSVGGGNNNNNNNSNNNQGKKRQRGNGAGGGNRRRSRGPQRF